MSGSESVLQRLNALFVDDPNIEELGLLPLASRYYFGDADADDRDEGFILHEHKLGISLQLVPPIFAEARPVIQHFLHSRTTIQPGLAAGVVEELSCATRAILLISPDNTTAWSFRKQLLEHNLLDPRTEIRLLDLIFSKHPKSAETWSHRRWVLQRSLRLQERWLNVDNESTDTVVSSPPAVVARVPWYRSELALCARMADLYPKNYYAWNHRRWVCAHLDSPQLIEELNSMVNWIQSHVSDHSGYHHRQSLLLLLLKLDPFHLYLTCTETPEHLRLQTVENDKTRSKTTKTRPRKSASSITSNGPECRLCELWRREILLSTEMLEQYPGHEAMWDHRRFIIRYWLMLDPDHDGQLKASLEPTDLTKSARLMRDVSLTLELEFIADILAEPVVASMEEVERHKASAGAHKLWLLDHVLRSDFEVDKPATVLNEQYDKLYRSAQEICSDLIELHPRLHSLWNGLALRIYERPFTKRLRLEML